MNLEQALQDLARALDERAEPDAGNRLRAATRVIVGMGAELLGIEQAATLSLHDVIRHAVNAPATPARRDLAVLLVQALATEGLLTSRSNRGQFDRDLCAFMEIALPNILRRSGYPAAAETYEKRRSLERLHTEIDELLKPLEPTFPPRIQGLYAG